MNILIIDGEQDKELAIANLLNQRINDLHIRYINNYRDASRFIDEYHDDINIIVLDWSFPFNPYMNRYTYGIGALLLDYLRVENYNIKTYLFTADKVEIDNNLYPFVEGTIDWSNSDSFISSFNSYFPDKEANRNRLSKCIKKPSEGRYVRKKASTPWWL